MGNSAAATPRRFEANPSPADSSSGVSRIWRLVTWTILAMLLASATIQYSLRLGRLSVAPDWDDVMYMNYGAERLTELQAKGLGECLSGFVRNTPHAPFSCLVAFLSFIVFGLREWAPYFASFSVVVVIFLLADWLLRGTRFGVKLFTVLYLCSFPALVVVITDFKPDMPWGVALALVAFNGLLGPFTGAALRRLLWLGFLSACLILAKPSTTPGTVALLGLVLVLAAIQEWIVKRQRPTVFAAARSFGIVLLTAALLCLPFFYLNWAYFDYYIRQTLFGEYRSAWYIPGGWPAQFHFFLDGEGGRANLAWHLYVIPLIWLTGWTVAILRRDRVGILQALSILIVTAACYAMPTLNPAKNTLLASPFFCMVIATTVFWIGHLARAEQMRFRSARMTTLGVVILAIIGPFLFRWPSFYYAPDSPLRLQSRRLHREVYDQLLRHSKPYRQNVTVTDAGPVRQVTLAWMAVCDGATFGFERPFSDKLPEYFGYFDRSDFVLAQEDGVVGQVGIMPNARVQGEVLEALRRREDFTQVADFTANNGKKLFLFKKSSWARSLTDGVRMISGFSSPEGPYPPGDPTIFCWGLGFRSTLLVATDNPGPGILRLSCRAGEQAKAMRVVVDGTTIVTHQFAGAWIPETVDVPLTAINGQEIELAYEPYHELKNTGRAVMFTKIALLKNENRP